VTLPEEAILFRAAVGHPGAVTGDPSPATVWTGPRSIGPAGRIAARVHDVLAFARMHLAGGTAPDGTRVLSAASARHMGEHQVDLPDTSTWCDSWGLGWARGHWDGHTVLGHDGSGIGQTAYLRMLPEHRFAVALLTNGGDTQGLYRELFGEVFRELAGVVMPAPLEPPAHPVNIDLAPYVGRYRSNWRTDEVLERDGALVLKVTISGVLDELFPELAIEYQLVPIAEGHFAWREEGTATWESVVFYTLPDGSRYLHHNLRANPLIT
jgi:hypothetical protein